MFIQFTQLFLLLLYNFKGYIFPPKISPQYIFFLSPHVLYFLTIFFILQSFVLSFFYAF